MRQQAFTNPNRACARTTTAMRGGEGFMQIHVQDIKAHVAGLHFA